MGDSGNCVQIKGLLPADKEVIYWTTDRMPQEHFHRKMELIANLFEL